MPPKKEKSDKKSIEKRVESGWWGKLFKAVIEVVNIVRRKDRKLDLKDGFFEKRDFLEHVGFFEDLKSSYPGVEVIEDKKNKKIRLKGRGDEFYDACKKCDNVLNQIKDEKQPLEDAKMWDIIANNDDYLKKIMAPPNIKAKVVLDGSGKSVRIVALNAVEWRKAEKALKESIIIEKVPVPSDADIISDSDDFQKFQKKQEKGEILKIELGTSNDRKSKVMVLVGAKDAVTKAKSLTEEFIASKRTKKQSLAANPSTTKKQPLAANHSTNGMCGTVTIVLKKGDITKCEGDAIINVLPDSLKLMDGGGVCKSILKCGGNTVQQEIDRIMKAEKSIPGARFRTSSGSIKNVKNIIHFVPSNSDISALQGDIENCLRSAQKRSFYFILIPAIGTAGFGLSPRHSAEIVLNAAENFSITSNHHLTLTIVVYQEEMFPSFKMVLEEKIKTSPSLVTQERNLVNLPSGWDAQPKGKVVHLVNLPPSSREYKNIFGLFNKGNRACEVTKIERIQNPAHYSAYNVKKQSMVGKVNDTRLFHGTNVENIVAINANNFSRSFAGENATVYGNGVYFAKNSSYSVQYCHSKVGYDFKMYIARVLVGEYTLGKAGMKSPPSRNDPNNPGLQFDSLVDRINDPSIFVIFQDNQHYPEYLVSFKKRK